MGVEAAIPRLPRRRARWLKRRLVYLPLALEIVKASNRKNMKRLRNLTAPLPGNVKRKIRRILQRDKRPSRWDVSHRFPALGGLNICQSFWDWGLLWTAYGFFDCRRKLRPPSKPRM